MTGPGVARQPPSRSPWTDALWGLSVLAAVTGLLLQSAGLSELGGLTLVVGATGLILLAMGTAGLHRRPWLAATALSGMAIVALGIGAALAMGGMPQRILFPILAAGCQLVLIALTVEAPGPHPGWGRRWIPITGHLLVAGASWIAYQGPEIVPRTTMLAYAAGFALLQLEAFWSYRSHGSTRQAYTGWEGLFLGFLGASLLLTTASSLVLPGPGIVPLAWVPPMDVLVQLNVVIGGAFLAGPPPLPEALQVRAGTTAQFWLDAITLVGLLNILILALLVSARWTLIPLFLAFTAWLVLAVGQEYWGLAHRFTRGTAWDPAEHGAEIPEAGITVVVPAFNEADVLEEALRENLALDLPLSFLLVPAARSTDGTVERCHALAEEHPDRVRVVEGVSGSKAGDLNQVWPLVDTDLVLLLDADETVSWTAVVQGLRVLQDTPGAGIVQGRKKARLGQQGPLDRLIGTDRRFSTLIEHPLLAEVFDAAHFAGSGALIRHRAIEDVGGWRDASVTEDIELTLRLYLETDWDIVYEPRMVVRELNPATFASLVRQRGRWARGWSQVQALHGRRLLLSARRVGWRRTFGLLWQLTTAISAPWMILLPVLTILWLVEAPIVAPATVGLVLAAIVLPARALTYPIAYVTDPMETGRTRPGRLLEVLAYGYLWIVLGWLFQLQAFYLEVSEAPRAWHGTAKKRSPPEGAVGEPVR